MKILLLDVETAPNLVHVWGLYDQNIGTNQIIASGYVLCYAAKWLNKDQIYFDSIKRTPTKRMIQGVHKLLTEADAVVHFNGTKFDIPTLNKEFVLFGLPPPKPYKQVDLLKTARKQFRFPSNRLDYLCESLELGTKHKHEGHTLWIKCMAKDKQAWKEMEEYNVNDVILLERLYNRLLPWVTNHPNHNLYGTECSVCPSCGSHRIQSRGIAVTKTLRYQRYQCQDCRSWFRGAKSDGPRPEDKYVGI